MMAISAQMFPWQKVRVEVRVVDEVGPEQSAGVRSGMMMLLGQQLQRAVTACQLKLARTAATLAKMPRYLLPAV